MQRFLRALSSRIQLVLAVALSLGALTLSAGITPVAYAAPIQACHQCGYNRIVPLAPLPTLSGQGYNAWPKGATVQGSDFTPGGHVDVYAFNASGKQAGLQGFTASSSGSFSGSVSAGGPQGYYTFKAYDASTQEWSNVIGPFYLADLE